MLELNKVYLGDCLEKVKDIEDNSINLIINDLPYNIAQDNKITIRGCRKNSNNFFTNKELWGDKYNDNMEEDDYIQFIYLLSVECKRVLKDDGSIILFFDRGRPYYLTPFYTSFKFRNMLSFVKNNPLPHIRKNNYRSGFELAAWFSKGKYYIDFISQKEMVNVFTGNIGSPKETKHPNEKYHWMIDPLIKRHSKEGDTVLDMFGGSGTTAIDCIRNKRNYILMESNPEFVEMANKRIEVELSQYQLF
jgi:DNA modification methylase